MTMVKNFNKLDEGTYVWRYLYQNDSCMPKAYIKTSCKQGGPKIQLVLSTILTNPLLSVNPTQSHRTRGFCEEKTCNNY